MPARIKRIGQIYGCGSRVELEAKFVATLREHQLEPRDERRTELLAYVSDNRWCADCPGCGSGIGADPTMHEGFCFECGGVYSIAFPDDWAEAEEVLAVRPPFNRHWQPQRETVNDLRLENAVNGVPVPGHDRIPVGVPLTVPQPDPTSVDRLAEISRRIKAGELPTAGEQLRALQAAEEWRRELEGGG